MTQEQRWHAQPSGSAPVPTTTDGFEIRPGRATFLPPHPFPPARPSRWLCIIDDRVRLPRLYVALCWIGWHELARRWLVYRIVGYRSRSR